MMDPLNFIGFRELLRSKSLIIRIDQADLFIVPESAGQHAGIGFKATAKAAAGNMDGAIEISATFKLPKGSLDGEVMAQSALLNKCVESLEFIKTTGRLESTSSTGDVLRKKKGKE